MSKGKISMVSLGCAKNRVDAEMLLYKLKQAGYEITDDPAFCDAAIVNTCGFIESAKQESIDEIIELGRLKDEGKIKAIVVTGCLAERYKEQVAKQLPEADAVIGIGANADIVSVVDKALNNEKYTSFPDKLSLPLNGERLQSTPFYTAYLKVAEGCDNRCAYCAIPLIRGGFRSRKLEDIVKEAKTLVQNGVIELNVIAQDTTRYGEDLYGKYMLPTLLKELCKIDGVRWIRVLYCYPDRITDELLDVMAQEDKIVKYMDIPLQHCNKKVLRDMNRRGDKESLTKLLNKVRQKVPGVVLRTTLIAGFPDESEEEFEELCQFVKEVHFDRLGCFAYSQEEDTPAAEMQNQIDEDVKEKRAEIIMNEQRPIAEDYCKNAIGKTLDVLVEGYDRYGECFFGRSFADAPEVDPVVFFTTNGKRVSAGEMVSVKITDYLDLDLVGELA